MRIRGIKWNNENERIYSVKMLPTSGKSDFFGYLTGSQMQRCGPNLNTKFRNVQSTFFEHLFFEGVCRISKFWSKCKHFLAVSCIYAKKIATEAGDDDLRLSKSIVSIKGLLTQQELYDKKNTRTKQCIQFFMQY